MTDILLALILLVLLGIYLQHSETWRTIRRNWGNRIKAVFRRGK